LTFTIPRAVGPLGVALVGLVLLACSTAAVGAQPPAGPPPGFNGPPPGGRPGGTGAGFQDEFAANLAANLGLPVETVKSALQQAQPDMPAAGAPPAFGGQGGPEGRGGPGDAAPPMPPAQGDIPGPGGPGFARGGPGPMVSDEMVGKLAAALGLPTDTVSGALQQTFQQMQPPGRPGGF
jgi:hypothetical protein